MVSMNIYTIGHSTHPIEEFIKLLLAYDVAQLVDIRTVPGSRHNPQFSQKALADELTAHGISYVYMKELGGLRYSKKDSLNAGWRNKSFRAYADYMQTDEFTAGVASLMHIAEDATTAIMCAEAVPWRCHRSLVGDALLVRGIEVLDIMSEEKTLTHKITSFAKVNGTEITYPAYEE